ncbi:MAG: CHAP domain-containing protein [Candidatus Wallbacteria bacterium]|nr:CHAP domain-containing protein [Candidatus Wallbacteria bacterium]
MAFRLEDLRGEYQKLFDSCQIVPARLADADRVVLSIKANRASYDAVSLTTGVPWYFIGVIHSLESNLNFKKHLHNGDPLSARTVNVPAGRPAKGMPPFTWEESAVDALRHKGFHRWTDWSPAAMLFKLEAYNGAGYHNRGMPSPYLWSFSQHWTKGKFVRDGVFDPEAGSKQCGAGVLLRKLADAGDIPGMARPVDLGAGTLPVRGTLPLDSSPASGPQARHVVLKRGTTGKDVTRLQKLLVEDWGFEIDVDGNFGLKTLAAVKQFQAGHHDPSGAHLVPDGIVGELTWRALEGRRALTPQPPPPAAPVRRAGISGLAMKAALTELAAGAGEVGGNNRGEWVRKYLRPTGLPEGNPWCAAFVSWCFLQAVGGETTAMPFRYSAGARDIFRQGKSKGWEVDSPEPGDLMVFWRESLSSGKGHIGFVEAIGNGFVQTIEGNKDPRVGRFQYVLGRIERLVGFIRVP